MMRAVLLTLFILFIVFYLYRLISHPVDTIDAALVAKIDVKVEDQDGFLNAISSYAVKQGLAKSESVRQGKNGNDVVVLQLKKGEEIVLVVVNSLVGDRFSVYFYGHEDEVQNSFRGLEKEFNGRWVMIL